MGVGTLASLNRERMVKRTDQDHYELSTGRRFYANNGVIGLSSDSPDLYEGYDGWVGEMEGNLTDDEKHEVAEFMIGVWQNWASN
jgi:hypothetical protein